MPDSDGDGLDDQEDQCVGEYGVDGVGCPYPDGDNVPDAQDQCPFDNGGGSPTGCPSSGTGCTTGSVDDPQSDADCDGIADTVDTICPNQPGPASNNGCPLSSGGGGGASGAGSTGTSAGGSQSSGSAGTTSGAATSSTSSPTATPRIASAADLARFSNCVVSTLYAERVRIRNAPSVDAEVVGGLTPGEIYAATLRETAADGDWFQVEGGWVAGWVTQQNAACADLPALGDEIVALPALGGESNDVNDLRVRFEAFMLWLRLLAFLGR